MQDEMATLETTKKLTPEAMLHIVHGAYFDFLGKDIKEEVDDTLRNESSDELLSSALMPDDPSIYSDRDDKYGIVCMDIQSIFEGAAGGEFDDFSFSLADSQELLGHENQVNQCLQDEGHAQNNVQLITDEKQINRVDVCGEDTVEIGQVLHKSNYQEKKLQTMKSRKNYSLVSAEQQAVIDERLKGACQAITPEPSKNPCIKQDDVKDEGELPRKKGLHNSNYQEKKVQMTNSAKNYPLIILEEEDSDKLLERRSEATHFGPHVHLWQFLLELLTDRNHRNAIQWLENEGEFILTNPELVAHLWGLRKNKPTMNYEKLSRALRYYYNGDIISKVPRKQFVYRFDCDLKMLTGYSALELNALVVEAELKAKQKKKMN